MDPIEIVIDGIEGPLAAVRIDEAAETYGPVLEVIDEKRLEIHAKMVAVAEAFWKERAAAIEMERIAPSGDDGRARYIAITLSVSKHKGSSAARWMDVHTRGSLRARSISRRTSKGTGQYHISNLKQGVPEHLHPAIEAAEGKLRILRKRMRQLGMAKRHLQEKSQASCGSTLSEGDWDFAKPGADCA